MFAVPGWSVSASTLKRQTEAHVKRDDNQQGKPSKKRKRKSAAVTDENVSSLWTQNIDKKVPGAANDRQSENPKKKSKTAGDAASTGLDHERGAIDSSAVKKPTKVDGLNPQPSSPTSDEVPAPKKASKPQEKPAKASKSSSKSIAVPPAAPAPKTPAPPPAAKLTPMQQKMREKLVSARFRHLNETLYTAPSATSLSMFAENPNMFEDYHSGFRRQVSVWPENPVDTFIKTIEARAKVRPQFNRRGKGKVISEANGGDAELEQLPRSDKICTIIDLGCGDAALARRLTESKTVAKRNLKVLSYDLASPNEFITKADIANLPISNGSVDVAIFCLALMGTNWIDFIEEAYRVLKWKGELWVAEIKSRFSRKDKKGGVVDHSVGKRRKDVSKKKPGKTKAEEEEEEEELKTEVDGEERKEETDVSSFVQVLSRRGFVLRKGNQSVDLGNKMFVRMEFIKAAPATVGKNAKQDTKNATQTAGKKKFVETEEVSREEEGTVLKPCLYKVR